MIRLRGVAACAGLVLFVPAALGDCQAKVKATGISMEDGIITVSVRVFASNQEAERTVSYMIMGDVKSYLAGKYMGRTPFWENKYLEVESGDEYSDEDVEIRVDIGDAFSDPRTTELSVISCSERQ